MNENTTKILVKGNFSEGNFGDDALLLSFHQIIKNIGVEYNTFYEGERIYYSKDLAKSAKNIPANSFSPDLIIYAGGTQFFSFSEKEFSFLKKLKTNILALIWKYKTNSKIILVGVGIGPFYNGINQHEFVKNILRKSSFTWVRDKFSKIECENLKIENCFLGSDLCFRSDFQKWCDIKISKTHKIKTIGVVLRDWKYSHGDSYHEKIFEFLQTKQIKKFDIKFYVFSEKKDKNLIKKLDSRGIVYEKWTNQYSFKRYISKLENCDLFITSRYHAAIFSILMSKPFITIGLDRKLTFLSSYLKDDTFNWNPYESVDLLFKKVNRINKNYNDYVNKINKKKLKMTKLADKLSNNLVNLLKQQII